jgi:ferrous iron transport protein B
MLSSFACAIPGILAARTISSPRERLATIMAAPLMSCSARLPVYLLLVGFVCAGQPAWTQAAVYMGCYLLGIAVAALVALAVRRFGRRAPSAPFILALPAYRPPQVRQVVRRTGAGTWAFLVRAGTLIFLFSILLWAGTRWPGADPAVAAAAADRAEAGVRAAPPADGLEAAVAAARANAEAREAMASSVVGRAGRLIEPAIAPLGFDWTLGIGIVGAMAARETFNSTLSIIASQGAREADEVEGISGAVAAMVRDDGRPVMTPLVAAALMVWFVIALQCLSTTALVAREAGVRAAVIQQGSFIAIAWIAAFVVYQGGRLLGFA